ncbi:hypothetical protein C8R44DRAFT_768055 [Mycena epipterygia]|nr:hypothetical protein C8R44DRAFT_768055 [Mycena epipterygia]
MVILTWNIGSNRRPNNEPCLSPVFLAFLCVQSRTRGRPQNSRGETVTAGLISLLPRDGPGR